MQRNGISLSTNPEGLINDVKIQRGTRAFNWEPFFCIETTVASYH